MLVLVNSPNMSFLNNHSYLCLLILISDSNPDMDGMPKVKSTENVVF